MEAPFGDPDRILVLQGSPPELLVGLIAGKDVRVASSVGNESGVSVGRAVSVGIVVGGNEVAVGTAA